MSSENIDKEVGKLYKQLFGKLLSSLLYFSKSIDLEAAEDIVNDVFASALKDWKENKIPDNPSGWLYKSCKNKGLNWISSRERQRQICDKEDFAEAEKNYIGDVPFDPDLNLLFTCAHPELAPKTQVVVALKYVANLKIDAIAKALAMTVEGIDKLLQRAKSKIKTEKISFAIYRHEQFINRREIVHKIIYLIFNEGYKSSWGNILLREELCEEAIIMAKTLIESDFADEDTFALYALMLFHSARMSARFDADGLLLDLEEQDRTLWNRNLISLGTVYLNKAKKDKLSTYQLEAAIAFLHCSCSHYNTTNWTSITKLYEKLLEFEPNPFTELNYAIALWYSGKKNEAKAILIRLTKHPFLSKYHLLSATLGKIHLREGNLEVAKKYFLKSYDETESPIEKAYLKKLLSTTNSRKVN